MSAGRPPIYENYEAMQPVLNEWANRISEGIEKPTVTGLCIALGFDSKDTLYRYRDNPEFSYPIKRALLLVEHGYEQALAGNSCTGSIFALKNMGWKDKTESDVNHNGGVNVIMRSVHATGTDNS